MSKYIVYGTDVNGCKNNASATVDVIPLPHAIVTLDTSVICRGTITKIWASGGDIYNWKTPDNLISIVTTNDTIYVQPLRNTTYSIIVQTNTNGVLCANDTTVIQKVVNCNSFFLPNAFSPNSSEPNVNHFKPIGNISPTDDYRFEIWNRWGQLLFETTNARNPGWDGKVKDGLAPGGVYIYHLRVDNKIDPVFEKVGTVTLIQ